MTLPRARPLAPQRSGSPHLARSRAGRASGAHLTRRHGARRRGGMRVHFKVQITCQVTTTPHRPLHAHPLTTIRSSAWWTPPRWTSRRATPRAWTPLSRVRGGAPALCGGDRVLLRARSRGLRMLQASGNLQTHTHKTHARGHSHSHQQTCTNTRRRADVNVPVVRHRVPHAAGDPL